MARTRFIVPLVLMALVVGVSPAFAGAKLTIDDKSSIDFGFRVQALTIVTQEVGNDGDTMTTADWKVRRGRLRVKGMIGKYTQAFIQTDVGDAAGGAGQSARVIDAYVQMSKDPWAQLIMGLNMAPANRQNLTTSGALMAIDRPGIAYKSLDWGARALRTFSNNTISGTSSGLSVGVGVRDLGVTLFGAGKAGDNASVKYYVGLYDGVNASGEDTPHFSVRGQLNFFDAESGYYNSSTYLGKKKTVAFGVSYDLQTKVAVDTTGSAPEDVDYAYLSADVFVEWPTSDGAAFTLEGAWSMLDFGDVARFMGSQGTGFYAQAGYFVKDWQPWGGFEMWTSDADDDTGNFNQFRVGITRFLQGQNANVKLGFEMTKADNPILGTEDTVNAVVLGMFTTY